TGHNRVVHSDRAALIAQAAGPTATSVIIVAVVVSDRAVDDSRCSTQHVDATAEAIRVVAANGRVDERQTGCAGCALNTGAIRSCGIACQRRVDDGQRAVVDHTATISDSAAAADGQSDDGRRLT